MNLFAVGLSKSLMIIAIALFSNHANALEPLVQQGIPFQGAVITTILDSNTSLQWLSPTATTRQSVNSVLSGYGGWVAAGFRYATISDFANLLVDSGLTNTARLDIPAYQSISWNDTANIKRMEWLVTAMGWTYVNNQPSQYDPFGQKTTYGILDNGPIGSGQYPAGLSYAWFYASQSGAYSSSLGQWASDSQDNLVGSFLVRTITPVSEPETYALLLTGLGLIAAAIKRRKAKQA
jgi:hypothetical protein